MRKHRAFWVLAFIFAPLVVWAIAALIVIGPSGVVEGKWLKLESAALMWALCAAVLWQLYLSRVIKKRSWGAHPMEFYRDVARQPLVEWLASCPEGDLLGVGRDVGLFMQHKRNEPARTEAVCTFLIAWAVRVYDERFAGEMSESQVQGELLNKLADLFLYLVTQELSRRTNRKGNVENAEREIADMVVKI